MRKILFIVSLLLITAAVAWAADLRSNIVVKVAVDEATTVSNNDNTVGAIIDGLGYKSVTYVIKTATLADSDVTLTPTIHECDAANCSDAAVATKFVGTIAGATFAATDDNTVKTIGYTGGKRYTRITITPANNTGSAVFSAVAILGHRFRGPTTQ